MSKKKICAEGTASRSVGRAWEEAVRQEPKNAEANAAPKDMGLVPHNSGPCARYRCECIGT
jgi:hypothetical protein